MGQVKVVQRHRTDGVFIWFIILVIAGLHRYRFREGVLTLKEHFQGPLHLFQRPAAPVVGVEQRHQHIGVMADLVQVIAVFVIVMGTLIAVQIALQLVFHPGVSRLRAQHSLITGGVGGAAHHRQNALRQHGAGGHPIEEDAHHQKQADHNEKALFVPPDKACGLFRFLCRLFCGLCRVLRSFDRGTGRLPRTFGGGVLFPDGSFLLPTGDWVTGKLGILPDMLLIQHIHIGLFQFSFRFCRLPVGAQLLGTARVRRQTRPALGGFFQPVGALHAHVIMLCLADLPMDRTRRRMDRSSLNGVGQLGDRRGLVHFLKPRAGLGLASGGVHSTLLDRLFLLRHLLTRRVRLIRRFVRTANMFLQPGVSTLGIGKLETGIFRPAHRSVPFNFLPGLGVEIVAFSTFFCSNCWRTEGFSCFPRHCSAASSNSSTASSAE